MKLTKIWVTKYALTSGVHEFMAQVGGNTAMVPKSQDFDLQTYYGNEWHTPTDASIARAREMREEKLESLRKQIDKLENMIL